jgi:hypothetical protein
MRVTHHWVVRNYLIFYLVAGEIEHIVHILHGAQD